MSNLVDDFQLWHKKYFPEWYSPIPSEPVFENGRHVGQRINGTSFPPRELEFEDLMKRLKHDLKTSETTRTL